MTFQNVRIHSNLGDIHAGDVGNGIKCLPNPDCSNLSSKFVSAGVNLIAELNLNPRGVEEDDVALAAVVGSPTKRHAGL